ncbi:MAG: sigma 54-interacting transcriptional regulator [Clostridiales Family XIII bacterium]|nr:sigma 54-interacting transcriptional regulator [Clostridiales Family XIII bacterium]
MKQQERDELLALRRENRLLNDILDHINEGVFCVDADGKIIYYNHTSELDEGLRREDVLGKYEYDVYKSTDFTDNFVNRVKKTKLPIFDRPCVYKLRGQEIKTVLNVFPFYHEGRIAAIYSIGREMNHIKSFIRTTQEFQKKMLKNELNPEGKSCAVYTFGDIIGGSDSMRRAVKEAEKISESGSTVLISGETGTGKELFAHSIHNASALSNGPFIPVNCAAIPEGLAESVLFGTVKGAFTGAENLTGLFEQAEGGTIFLDEINSLPMSLQAKLLRFLENRVLRRLGGKSDISVNCRILSAINEDPLDAIQGSQMRKDLFFRLSAVSLLIPPLREHLDDLPDLCAFFMSKYNKVFGRNVTGLSEEAETIFRSYRWPGNVRELSNTIESVMVFLDSETHIIEPSHLPSLFWEKYRRNSEVMNGGEDDAGLREKTMEYEWRIIAETLRKHDGNITRAASDLKTSRQYIYSKMRKTDI